VHALDQYFKLNNKLLVTFKIIRNGRFRGN